MTTENKEMHKGNEMLNTQIETLQDKIRELELKLSNADKTNLILMEESQKIIQSVTSKVKEAESQCKVTHPLEADCEGCVDHNKDGKVRCLYCCRRWRDMYETCKTTTYENGKAERLEKTRQDNIIANILKVIIDSTIIETDDDIEYISKQIREILNEVS